MITASIVVYKTDVTELSTILECTINSCIEKVYVVDNSPSDFLRSFVDLSIKIEYIFGHGNVGYGAAHNIAFSKAIEEGAKYHVVINPDIYFKLGTIEQLVMYMDRNSDVGNVMPKVVYPDGTIQYLCKLLPTPLDLIGRRFVPMISCVEKRNHKFEMRNSGYNKEVEVPFLSGCFMFLRVDIIKKVNGFSSRYWMYCEDIDLCRRIGLFSKTMFFPNVIVVHNHKKESYINKKMLLEHIKSAVKYFNYWGWIIDVKRSEINKRILDQYKA